jgi:hypothetical protein
MPVTRECVYSAKLRPLYTCSRSCFLEGWQPIPIAAISSGLISEHEAIAREGKKVLNSQRCKSLEFGIRKIWNIHKTLSNVVEFFA